MADKNTPAAPVKVSMNTFDDLNRKFNCVVPVIYVLTDDEHSAINKIAEMVKAYTKVHTDVFIHKSTTGIKTHADYLKEIEDRKYSTDENTVEANNAFIHIYQQKLKDRRQIYIMTEADNLLNDEQIVRRVKDFAINADENDSNLKMVILLSSKLNLPAKLEKYVQVVVLPYPKEEEIINEIKGWIGKYNDVMKKDDKIEVRTDSETVNALKGLTIMQLRSAMTACLELTKPTGRKLDPAILNSLKREVVNKTSMLQIVDTPVNFEDVGGYGRIKQWLKKSYGGWTNEGKEYGLPHLKGLLMVGLPGCGKTELCKSLANEWKLNLVKFDPSNVFSSRVGESESNMERAISIIESLAPCVLFIDEMEKGFAGMQSSSFSDAGTTARVIGKFLMWMQDSEADVFTVSTVNHIQNLPAELISRFDEVFFFNLPNHDERKSILKIQIRKMRNDPAKFDLDRLAKACPNVSGREIMQSVKEALYDAFALTVGKDGKHKTLNTEILEEALRNKTPVMKTMEDQLRYIINWVGFDPKRKDGIRARFANDSTEDMGDYLKILEEEKAKKPATGPNVKWEGDSKSDGDKT